MKRDLKKIVSQMTLEEKAGMCSGLDFWHLKHVERLGFCIIYIVIKRTEIGGAYIPFYI